MAQIISSIAIDNDITRALARKIDRMQVQRRLMPYPPHEFTAHDLAIGNVQHSLRKARQWAIYKTAVKPLESDSFRLHPKAKLLLVTALGYLTPQIKEPTPPNS